MASKAKPTAAPHAAAKKPRKPAPVTAPKKAAETVTLKTVFEQLGETHSLPKKQTHGLLTDFVATVTAILKAGDRVRMSDLVRHRPAADPPWMKLVRRRCCRYHV
jgi:hypothetical protein